DRADAAPRCGTRRFAGCCRVATVHSIGCHRRRMPGPSAPEPGLTGTAVLVLNEIYTRTRDSCRTAPSRGERPPEHQPRIAAHGAVDETNAAIGMARLHARGPELADLDAMLARIQNDLFDVGADLCTPELGPDPGFEPLRVTDNQVKRIENEID